MHFYDLTLKLIKSNLFTGLAHPDAIKCFGFSTKLQLNSIYQNIAESLNRYNMYAEDSSGLYNNYHHKELGLNTELRKIFIRNKVKLFTASDAHQPEDVGKGIAILNKIQEKTNEEL